MNKVEIEKNLKTGKAMSRQDICDIAKNVDDTFRDTLLRNLIEELMSSGTITRIGRNCYIKTSESQNHKKNYNGMYSERASELIQIVGDDFPLLAFQVWELRWLNEFLNHLVGENIIFLDIERDGCEFVYEELRDKYDGELLLKPDAEQIYRYGKDGTIVIGRLVTEAPQGSAKASAPLERIMVELEANKVLRSLISTGEIPQIIRDMYDKYQVDSIKLLRYASRRNKKDAMMEVLGDRIMIMEK
ncbi:MAG: hypothetical protein LUG93_02375 [Lachnospiraceae bacterium]|nr:hypothetical protein [Lachnospiraceae bacterium]